MPAASSLIVTSLALPAVSATNVLRGRSESWSGVHLQKAFQTEAADSYPPGPTDPHFAVLAAGGCTGSTWVWQVLGNLMHAHYEAAAGTAEGDSWLPITFGSGLYKKEWLKDLGCTEHGQAPSVCEGKRVRCRPAERLVDQWSKLDGSATCSLVPDQVSKLSTNYTVWSDPRPKMQAKLYQQWGAAEQSHRRRMMRPPTGQRYIMPLVVFKGHLHDDYTAVWKTLNPQRTRMVGLVRSNALDRLTCQTFDCFVDGSIGFPVDGSGKRHQMERCMLRRRLSGFEDFKVYLDPRNLLAALRDRQKAKHQFWWKNPSVGMAASEAVDVVSLEDLSAFESSANPAGEDWQTSVDGFFRLMQGLGLPANKSVIRKILWREMPKNDDGSFHTRQIKRHRDEIYNADEVRAAIQGTEFAEFWRD
eukprot:TRINITY_DN9344_c0_g1_i1.p1 TRINITY_DN9344_c0_g1~~TRINITY_DN9344_c0_g1_i1.p1  ORF type:complete len:417 (-),score=68.87 TRINITY_DN9344_c0_g1_i1:158-1408(-)